MKPNVSLAVTIASLIGACGGGPTFLLQKAGTSEEAGASIDGGSIAVESDASSIVVPVTEDAGASSPGAPDTGSPLPVASGDAAVTIDAAVASDAAAQPIDAGNASDASASAGVICGATTCASPQVCCVLANGTETCQAANAACAGAARACDDPSDCTAGACCYSLDGTVAGAECRNDCNGGGGGRVEACVAQSDCVTGTCMAHTCTSGAPIWSCAALPPICP